MPYDIPTPMLAKAATTVPDPAKFPEGLLYEPKWDGFRGLISWDGTTLEIGSRGAKPLTRYFPELVEALPKLLPGPCLLDGEIVVPTPTASGRRLNWEALSARIHPAASRVAALAAETPAMFIAFDMLADGDDDLQRLPFAERRTRLESRLGFATGALQLTRTTRDRNQAVAWLRDFEGAGLDGIVAKPLGEPYAPGKRTLIKVKHSRSADVIALGYRIHKSGHGLGSLLVGLYDADGTLTQVGGVSAFTDARRLGLVDELAPLVLRDEDGAAVSAAGEKNRFSAGKDVSFVRLRPERVLEVKYDQVEGARFRHTVQFLRWRDDRDPASCTYEQLETVNDYDLADVLQAPA